jgi:hypothetical protein
MNQILAGLTFTVVISIGSFAVALSVDIKGKVKGDVSYSTENYARGRSGCLINCDPNYSDGVGTYRSVTVGEAIQARTKVYENGAILVDAVASKRACYGKNLVCVKGAVSKRLTDNFNRKEDSIPHSLPFNVSTLKPNETSQNLLSSSKIYAQPSPLQTALVQTKLSTPLLATSTFSSAAQSKQNKGTKKRGKQLYELLKAGDPLFRGL